MPDRWIEERERRWRERNWRNEAYGRGGGDEPRQGRLWQEDRSFDDARGGYGEEAGFSSRDRYAARYEGRDRDRVFGERDTGAEYNRSNVRSGGGAYGAGGSYGGGQSYGQGAGGGRDRQGGGDYRSRGFSGGGGGRDERPEWQDRDYTGVSPAYENNEYDLERNRGMRFESQDYTRGGRFYGDDRRQPIYRQEYGQGGREYGEVPRGYDADREMERRYAREMQRPASGGTGGYDFERGYGDAGRTEDRGGMRDWQRGDDRGEDRGRSGGGFLQRAKSWLGEAVDEVRRDLSGGRGQGDQDRGPQRYSADFNREARWQDPGHRGRGPKGYKRSDERINDDAHQRLTDDPWLDASNINVSVSGGEVTLSGTVENREAKHRAERCVEDISGVTHVQNNLRIESGGFLTNPGKGYGDSVLEAQMRKDGGDGNVNGGASVGEDTASTRTTTRRT